MLDNSKRIVSKHISAFSAFKDRQFQKPTLTDYEILELVDIQTLLSQLSDPIHFINLSKADFSYKLNLILSRRQERIRGTSLVYNSSLVLTKFCDEIENITGFTQTKKNEADENFKDIVFILRFIILSFKEIDFNAKPFSRFFKQYIVKKPVIEKIFELDEVSQITLCKIIFEDFSINPYQFYPYAGNSVLYQISKNQLTEILVLLKNKYAGILEEKKLLHEAILHKDLMTVKYLLEMKIDLETKDDEGRTPIESAMDFNHIEIIYTLLIGGAELDDLDALTDDQIDGLLQFAIINEKNDWVETFLDWKANPNVAGPNKDYPLHQATFIHNTCAVELLLHFNAKVDCRDVNQNTPAHYAAENKNIEILEILVKSNLALCNIQNSLGMIPLMVGAKMGRIKTVKYLIKQMTVADINNAVTPAGNNALALAMIEGHTKSVIALLKAGVNPDIYVFNEGEHPKKLFSYAICKKNNEVVKYLLKKGININYRDNDQNTVVHEAASHNNAQILAELIARNRTLCEVQNNYGTTPFMQAIAAKAIECVMIFFEDLNQHRECLELRDSKGNTVFALAVAFAQVGLAEKLISIGANKDVFIYDESGVKNSLLEYVLTHDSAIHHCIPMLEVLLAAGINPNLPCQVFQKHYPLSLAVVRKNFEAAKVFLKKEVSVEVLYAAIIVSRSIDPNFYHYPDSIRNAIATALFTTARLKVCEYTPQGQTFLTLAISQENIVGVSTFLILGFDPYQADSNNEYPLILAIKKRNIDIINMLLETVNPYHYKNNFDDNNPFILALLSPLENSKLLFRALLRWEPTNNELTEIFCDAIQNGFPNVVEAFLMQKDCQWWDAHIKPAAIKAHTLLKNETMKQLINNHIAQSELSPTNMEESDQEYDFEDDYAVTNKFTRKWQQPTSDPSAQLLNASSSTFHRKPENSNNKDLIDKSKNQNYQSSMQNS